MYRFVFCCLFLIICASASAQTSVGLVAHYTFDGNLADLTGNSANGGVASGVPEFSCGVDGQGLQLFGGNDFVRIPGGTSNNVNREFDTEDFSVSFYFKSVGFNGTQYLLSKRDTACDFQSYFYIRYAPASRNIMVYLRQGNQEVRIDHRLVNANCWQHVALVRDNRRVRLYMNGEFVGEQGTTSRVDIFNSGELTIGSSNCRGANETSFVGIMDEVRVYNRALNTDEVISLYLRPDKILTPDQRLFLGEDLDVSLNSNCGVAFDWEPAGDVRPADVAEPNIRPSAAGNRTYFVRITDAESDCIALDSITLQVIDPNTLDCSQVFLPKAFTPNGIGPTANETFGISNPFAIPELLSFEIYNRWGGKMFSTTDAFARWDGTFENQAVNPGVYLWRVNFRCEDQEIVDSGSVTVLR